MSDRAKIILALIFFIGAVTLPLVGVATFIGSIFGWLSLDYQTSLIFFVLALVALVMGTLLLVSVQKLSWTTVSLPYVTSAVYSILPDLIPGGVDDAAVMLAGSVFSFILGLRRDPKMPKWVILILIAAAIYSIFGGAIPGPLDELVVDVLAWVMSGYIATRQPKPKAGSDKEGV